MSISDENRNKLTEIAGSQKPSLPTQKMIHDSLRRFKYHFPELNWWGNTPIEPTGAGLTYSESITWIRHILHHLSDWIGKLNEELHELENDLNDLLVIIQTEITNQLPEIITEFDLFDLIVTGNNEKISLVNTQDTSIKLENSVFSYAFRTEFGFIEATKTNLDNDTCFAGNATWIIHVNEKENDNLLDYYVSVNNIPAEVNRIWIINTKNEGIDGTKEIYFTYKSQIKRAYFDKTTMGDQESVTLKFERINTNYEPYWIVNVFKRVPVNQNYLHYMTLDYKVYEYNLETGDEELLYEIPPENQDIFDPISDVIEGKSTIWAVTYTGVTNRFLNEMNGLCFESCFDGVELYDTWETPKKLIFTQKFSGITPANMYQNYANEDEKEGDKSLISAFILAEKNEDYPYTLYIDQLIPRKFDNSIIADNLDEYFNGTILNDLVDRKSLSDYQGYFTYHLSDNIENFTDAPLLLLQDTALDDDGAKFILENSQFIASKDEKRWFLQRLKLINPEIEEKRTIRVYERVIEQSMKYTGLVMTRFSRWCDHSIPFNVEPLNKANTGNKMDYLSLAGTKKIYNASEYEEIFDDTPIKEYIYYGLPLDVEHPLLQNLQEKNVIIEITKGANYKKESQDYEIVFKLTYQDAYAELQMRRLMRFKRETLEEQQGGRTRAYYISPWAYVYYTVPDDSAPPGYEDNPNQGIDQEFWDIINNLQTQIDNINEEVTNIWANLDQVWDEINNINDDLTNIHNEINDLKNNNEAFKKILEHLALIGVWEQTGDTIFDGDFYEGMGVAGGNVNVFTGQEDGSTWIRTNNGKTENDIVAGI